MKQNYFYIAPEKSQKSHITTKIIVNIEVSKCFSIFSQRKYKLYYLLMSIIRVFNDYNHTITYLSGYYGSMVNIFKIFRIKYY